MQSKANVNSNITTEIQRLTILHNKNSSLCPVSTATGKSVCCTRLCFQEYLGAVPHSPSPPSSTETLLPKHSNLQTLSSLISPSTIPQCSLYFPRTFGITALSPLRYTVSSRKAGGKCFVNFSSYSLVWQPLHNVCLKNQ